MSRGISLSDLGGMPQDMTLEDARSMMATLGRLGQGGMDVANTGLAGLGAGLRGQFSMPPQWANRFIDRLPRELLQSDPGSAGWEMRQKWLGGAPSLGHHDIDMARRPGWVDRQMDTTGGSFSYFPQTTTPAADAYRRGAGNEIPFEVALPYLLGRGPEVGGYMDSSGWSPLLQGPGTFAPLPPRRPF